MNATEPDGTAPGPGPQPPDPSSAPIQPFVSPALRPPPPDPTEWHPAPTPRRRRRTGWIVAAVGVVLVAAIAAVFFGTSGLRPSGEHTAAAQVPVHQLAVGDCIDPMPPAGQVSAISVVECAQYHAGEVVASLALAGSTYPGDASIAEAATSQCAQAAASALEQAKATAPGAQPAITYFAPSQTSWGRGDKTVLCLVYASRPGLTGSLTTPSPTD